MKLKELITEAPYLHHEELPYKALSSISADRLRQAYTKLGSIGDGIDVFLHSGGNIMAGKLIGDEFYLLVSLSTREHPYPVVPTQLDDIKQVSMVNVATGEQEQGFTRKVYALAAASFDLVSDHEQYLGAQGLWKSLARSKGVNVYVFDGNRGDYVRDAGGEPVRYNGSNVPAGLIWGSTAQHRAVLLVGTAKDIA